MSNYYDRADKRKAYDKILTTTFVGGAFIYPIYKVGSLASQSLGKSEKDDAIAKAQTELGLTEAKQKQGITQDVIPYNIEYTMAGKKVQTQEFRSISLDSLKAQQVQNLTTAKNMEARSPVFGCSIGILTALGLSALYANISHDYIENAADFCARIHVAAADGLKKMFKKNKAEADTSKALISSSNNDNTPTVV